MALTRRGTRFGRPAAERWANRAFRVLAGPILLAVLFARMAAASDSPPQATSPPSPSGSGSPCLVPSAPNAAGLGREGHAPGSLPPPSPIQRQGAKPDASLRTGDPGSVPGGAATGPRQPGAGSTARPANSKRPGAWTPGQQPAATVPPPAAQAPVPNTDAEVLPIDLPTALRIVNAANPTIQIARVRVQEAYYRQRQAEVGWLPNLQAATIYNRHDGLIQNSTGLVFPTSKWNFFEGGGALADLPLPEVIFLPIITRRLTAAAAAHARVVTQDIDLDVALTYLDLLGVYSELVVNAEALAYAEQTLRIAQAAEEAGAGKTPADLPRARTEVNYLRGQRADLFTRVDEAAARLAQLLLLPPTVDLRPADPTIVPIDLVNTDVRLDELVAIGLMNRPELAEQRAVVAAALAYWRQARVGPLLPHLTVSYLAGEFGGGLNDEPMRFGGRGDGTAQAVWELHNLGAGDYYKARERRARYSEENLHLIEVQAMVGAQVSAAAKDVRVRAQALAADQTAVQQAEETWRRLLGAAFGLTGTAVRRYDPLEPFVAERQVMEARLAYVRDIIEYNKAQFRLYAYMGRPPICALPRATARPVEVGPVPRVPSPREAEQELRLNIKLPPETAPPPRRQP